MRWAIRVKDTQMLSSLAPAWVGSQEALLPFRSYPFDEERARFDLFFEVRRSTG